MCVYVCMYIYIYLYLTYMNIQIIYDVQSIYFYILMYDCITLYYIYYVSIEINMHNILARYIMNNKKTHMRVYIYILINIISYYIILYHIISYYIMLYHIILYYIIFITDLTIHYRYLEISHLPGYVKSWCWSVTYELVASSYQPSGGIRQRSNRATYAARKRRLTT